MDLIDSFGFISEVFLKLLIATFCGAIIGIERERIRRPAGLKTIVFVCVGSTLFSITSLKFGEIFGGDPTRIASQVATGIGFIGAGTILRREEGGIVEGLTTASIIWFYGAVGIMIGMGYIFTPIAVSLGAFIFLRLLELFELRFFKKCKTFKVSMEVDEITRNNMKEKILNLPRPLSCKSKHFLSIENEKLEFEFCSTHHKIELPKTNKIKIYEI